jgi:predicted kinase
MKLILMRGCSGSGKSTLARTLAPAEAIFSTDDLFMVDGEYCFNPMLIADKHRENQRRVEMAMRDMVDVVVVDNTNTCAWEMVAYVDLADTYGYDVDIVESNTSWRFDADELFARNSHGVPREAIKAQIARYEHGVTVDDVRVIVQQQRRNQ